jgi:MATE family multidrug resistance protein
METPLIEGEGDYAPARTVGEVRRVFCRETVKMWKIAGPIAFNILCQFGINSVTNIFVGHMGDIQLSAVSISLSVIGTFSFGFMVCLSLSL